MPRLSLLLALLTACAPSIGDTGALDTGLSAEPKSVGTPTWPIASTSASYPSTAAYCYHYPGSPYHKPGAGVANADDLYAVDINCASNAESAENVYPVRDGTVVALGRGANGSGGSTSYVLVQHPESITIDGVAYASFYTAYLHMATSGSLSVGSAVTTSTVLGTVDDYGSYGAVHLHFVGYVGEWISTSNWGRLRSFDLSNLGGDFSSYGYGSYIVRHWVDNSASSGSYQFVSGGTAADLYTSASYGQHGSMAYTASRNSATSDNTYEFKWNMGLPASHAYYVWPFIPRNYGTTTRAPYTLTQGTSTTTSRQSAVTSFTVNQYSISDDYAPQARRSMSSGRYVTLKVGDGTSESGKYVAADYAVLFWKADHCLGANCASIGDDHKYYCYKTDYENNTDNCTASASLPAGF